MGNKKFPPVSSEVLRAAREEMGLTQQEAADKYRISLIGYKQYELGKRPIPGPIALLTEYFLKDHRRMQK
jgi:transcriptional regulator with XRE-family HTH domain